MPGDVEFGVLGPLLIRVSGKAVPIPRGKQRTLLAVLLLRAGRIVPAGVLADLLWDPEPPPPSAGVTLQNYVKRLRQVLGPSGRERIITQPGGYLIRVEPGELDLTAMEQALTAARRAARDAAWPCVAEEAAAALALWRGEALCDVDLPPSADPEVVRLAELRMQASELRAEADLRLARHAEVVAELEHLAAAAPLREHLQALLMLALCRCGRRAEALEAYRRVAHMLIEELGSEPGPELQELHRQILRDDPALAAPRASISSPAAGTQLPALPRQLPAAVASFTGRAAELAALTGLLGPEQGSRAPALVISAIGGTAGVGKTALAIQWAHQVAERFPDGQLYVNLRGYDPDQPVAAADALAGFLRALGVPGTDIPDGAQERASLYRNRLAGRRMLVVLDNARDGSQVRPLLPGDPGCSAVVTSRDALAGLVAADGARRLDLDVLPIADAVALLRSLVGGRVDEDPEAAVGLAGLCARLPLALRIAAELAATRPGAPLRDLVAELSESRLDLLDVGEDRTDVRSVFSWSVRQLPDEAAAAFALTGLHPGEDFDLYAAAALTGATTAEARRILDRLHRASLLQAAGPDRYGMHDLLRAYARERAAADDTDGQSVRALTRLFDYYLAAAATAMDNLVPAEAHLRPRVSTAAAVVPQMRGESAAQAWLDNERANLAAAVAHCAGYGWPRHATDLAGTLFRYLMTGSHLPDAQMIYGHALQAARLSGNVAAEASALNGLGGIGIMKGHFRDAAGHYQAALRRYRDCQDRAGEAKTLHNLGITEIDLHNYQSAAGYYGQAITAYEDAGDRLGGARALADLAGAETELGSYDEASEHLQLALGVLRDVKDQHREAQALSRMGDLSLRRGQLTQAAEVFEQSLAIYRRIGDSNGVADGLRNLGAVSLGQGEPQQATGYLRQALTLYRRTGDQFGEIIALRKLAEALRGEGQPAAARAELQNALGLAAETGNTYEQASAHHDLAENYDFAGDYEHARHNWQQALDLYTHLGAPEAEQVRSRLGELRAGTLEDAVGDAVLGQD
jgi:DNA-binding SARP family transcriptional activator/tetratricopeptide (TPR) repeat protein